MTRHHHPIPIALWLMATFCMPAAAADRMYTVEYPPSDRPGELSVAATYRLWVPEGVERLRAIIVHQHGCGAVTWQRSDTAAYDLHWQAFARKWDSALLGPSYHQGEKDNCLAWCDPRNGSSEMFIRALRDLADRSGHGEVRTAPWCLWGHSGGGYWVSTLLTMHPERIAAVWIRSGATDVFFKHAAMPEITDAPAVLAVPVMCNPGIEEQEGEFAGIYDGTVKMFKAYRAMGAPIGLAPDPRTGHECGDQRYLAIAFLDACLTMRLPAPSSADLTLRPVDMSKAWLAAPLSDKAVPAAKYGGNPAEAAWLPDQRVARAWMEYVKTGAVGDATPPPRPFSVQACESDGGVHIRWNAHADFESGLGGFIVLRDGRELARLPAKPHSKYGRPLFQGMNYHDTPRRPLPRMEYFDTSATRGTAHVYSVIAVNSVGLRSEAVAAVRPATCTAPPD